MLWSVLPAQARDLVVLVDTATEMPLARFENGRLVDGIQKDIGDALARNMDRTARFVILPRKRIVRALEAGDADVLCNYVPEWLDGSFDWSRPFIPIGEVLIADRSVPRPQSIADIAGRTVGTVLGYQHPEFEQVLGKNFVREDAPSAEINLRKLAAGRIKYAVAGKAFFDYRMKLGDLDLNVYPPLVVKTYMGQCAVSRKGHVAVDEVDRAIARIVNDGTMTQIMWRYR
jgi:ABC-type amino acid transport substrate-binding protein